MNYNEVEILLIEDNIYDAEMTLYSLNKINLGNNVYHVKDGEEALDFIFCKNNYASRRAIKPKLILLDIKMPKVDGIEVLRQIKLNDCTKRIPVVIMTSSKEEKDILAGYDLGVNSYVVKPVDFEGFVKAVGELGLYWVITNVPSI